ncbi:hypothetical protein BDA99DRAFT_532023 [Phascolomyces articulosus]|uniref:Uncharacterized protein n=1 Tax=Phascolomyces articulosus TaxID=60185 RepID=A0AAD5PLB7_9FUNG|nr:hypothetical protein BDA99DRAFT_532023 [Phascolomyces articulosus]
MFQQFRTKSILLVASKDNISDNIFIVVVATNIAQHVIGFVIIIINTTISILINIVSVVPSLNTLLPLIEHNTLSETHINHDPNSLLDDYVGSYQVISGDEFDVLSCEVKSFSKKSSSQVQSDLTKQVKEIKQILYKSVDYEVIDPIVVGILVKEYSITTYYMRLIEHGYYVSYEHGSLTLHYHKHRKMEY